MRLNQDVELSEMVGRLQAVLPQGIEVLSTESVDPLAPPLQSVLTAAEYDVTLPVALETQALGERVDSLLAQTSILRQRRDKTYDLRPLIEALRVERTSRGEVPRLHMRLSAREGATGRPDEILAALGIPIEDTKIERTNLIFGK